MPYVHPTYGAVPETYRAPISEEVAAFAQHVAADELATTPAMRDDVPRLYAYVRAAMGRRPAAEVDRDHPSMDDESISEGIVRALNVCAGTIVVGTRVALAHDVERFPHFIAPAGSTGTVIDTSCGNVCVRMDDTISGAEDWANEIVWGDASLADLARDVRIIGEEG